MIKSDIRDKSGIKKKAKKLILFRLENQAYFAYHY